MSETQGRGTHPARTVLVTGGAGFIGSAYLRRCVPEEPSVRYVCLDALTYAGNLANLRPIWGSENFSFVHGSVTNAELVSHLCRTYPFDLIIHFAAESHVDRSILGETVFVETNVLGTQALLTAARMFQVRMVLVSTDEVYGDLSPTDPPFSVMHPLRPSSPYSAAKASADLLALAAYRTYGTDVIITRCSNNFGPYQFPEKLIPLMIQRALEDQPLPVYGDGRNIRDWLYVDDHVEGIRMAAVGGATGQIYNLGGSCERENIAIVRAILKELGKPESLISYVTDRPGHDRRYSIDFSRTTEQLGWSPQGRFEENLVKTIRWYQDHQEWCREIESGAYRRLTPELLSRENG